MTRTSDPSRPKLLMVTHRVPYPPDKGDRIRTWHTLRQAARQFDVSLACLADEPLHIDAWRALRDQTERVAIEPVGGVSHRAHMLGHCVARRSFSEGAFYSPRLLQTIRQWHEDEPFDAALGVCSSMARYVADLDGPYKVLDLIDVDSRKWSDYADTTANPVLRRVYRLEAGRVAQCERWISERFDAVSVVTDSEAELLSQMAPQARIVVANNGVDLDYFRSIPQTDKPTATFVGALDYRPNVDGVVWLARKVWPELRRRVPRARLRIVGRRPAADVAGLAELPGVDVVRDVPDIRPHLAEAGVAVAPLHIARGIQNKVLEAMATARATVVTPAAAEGIAARPGRDYVLARSDRQWIDELERLLVNPAVRWPIGHAAREFVERHHDWRSCLTPLMQKLRAPRADAETMAIPRRRAA